MENGGFNAKTVNSDTHALVSVIIPAYNCSKFIRDTLSSVTNQTLREIEILIINDGSTDDTLSILEQINADDERIKIINVENGGPAKARNIGISRSSGKYIYFMDSDDIISDTMLFDMYSLANRESLQVCACGYIMENAETKTTHTQEFLYEGFVTHTQDQFRMRLMPMIKAHLMYVVWNKLYERNFIVYNKIEFTDYLSGEDRLFNTHTFKHISRFGFINKAYYRYFLRGQSTLANRYVKNRFEAALKCHLELIWAYKEMGMYNEKNKAYIDFVFIKGVMSCFTQLNSKACPLSKRQKRAYISTTLDMPWVKEALKSHDDEFSYSKRINSILRTGNTSLICMTAKAIFVMQFKLNKVYLKLKHSVKK